MTEAQRRWLLPNHIDALKRRRDELLNRACTLQERPAVHEEVRALNRRIWTLEGRI